MKTLSVCMIVKNESKTLPRLIPSLSFADEIIIVDTGSTDDTKKLIASYGISTYEFKWINDFSAARNYAFSLATKEYIMWLDADDFISDENVKKIEKWKYSPTFDTVMAKYVTAFDEYGATFYYYRERIVKNCPLAKWVGAIHEVIVPFGTIEYADFEIWHKPISSHTKRNLTIFKQLLKGGLDERLKFYYARELLFSGNKKKAIPILKEFAYGKSYFADRISALITLSNLAEENSDIELAKKYLVDTFTLSTPQAEACCNLANLFHKENKIDEAIFWYKTATCVTQKIGFIQKDYTDVIPYTNLCVLYYEKNDLKTSEYYSKKAEAIKPNHPAVKHNADFFKSLKK